MELDRARPGGRPETVGLVGTCAAVRYVCVVSAHTAARIPLVTDRITWRLELFEKEIDGQARLGWCCPLCSWLLLPGSFLEVDGAGPRHTVALGIDIC